MRIVCQQPVNKLACYQFPAHHACDGCGRALCDTHDKVTRYRQDLCSECYESYVARGRLPFPVTGRGDA